MKILSAKYSEDTKGYISHYHDAHELIYITAGRISVSIGDEKREAGAGSLLVLSRLEEHSVQVLTREYRRYTLLISPETSGGDEYLLGSVLINRKGGFDRVIDLGKETDKIERILQKTVLEYSLRLPMYEKMLDSMLTELLVRLYRLHPEYFLSDENVNTETVRQLQTRFEQSYAEQFSLSALAGEYHISPSHLSHIFKSITGYSPIDYLISCRLSAAKNLLAESKKSIKEIVDACGFSDESNFSRTFKKKTGLTPSEFRRQNSRKALDKAKE